MDRAFPLGFPGPTAFYLVLYVATLAVHVAFMSYVLAGTAVLAGSAIGGLRRRGEGEGEASVDERAWAPLVELLRDWLPFALSAAITAGIAPLLLLQILYKKPFYTANLLLFHRWMAILPVLIAGFYLLYLLRGRWLLARPRLRVAVGLLAAGCFGFTALSWTENALLARDPEAWPRLYESGAMVYRSGQILPRLALWAAGTLPTMAPLLGWQVLRKARLGAGTPAEARWLAALGPLAALALGGLGLAGAAAGAYAAVLGTSGRAPLSTPAATPYVALAGLGVALQAAAWAAVLRRPARPGRWLGLASAGAGLCVVGMTVAREVLRIGGMDLAALYPEHARAAQVGGVWVFFLFLAVNGALAAWAIRTVVRKASAVKTPG